MRERPPAILAIGGIDPTGGAGIAMDARAAAGSGVVARTVAAAITIQDTRRVSRVEPVRAATLEATLRAALDEGVDAVKTGLLPDAATIRLVAGAIPRDLPLVVDPVLHATSGDRLANEDAVEAYSALASRATLMTPNAAEARELTGLDPAEDAVRALAKMGARNVLVKGGDAQGERVRDLLLTERGSSSMIEAPRIAGGPWRGTGCALATLCAAHLAQGFTTEEAAMAAIGETREAIRHASSSLLPSFRSLLPDARRHDATTRSRLARVAAAWRALEPLLARQDVPEVGANLSFLPETGDPRLCAALSARCVRTGTGTLIAGPVEVGGAHHTARIAAVAHEHDARVLAALNLRYRHGLVEAARKGGLLVAAFRREDQPDSEPSTVAWGTSEAIKSVGRVPDLIYDLGAIGKEPMIRVLGETPEDVSRKAILILS